MKLIEIALSQYGIKEIKGESNNPEVIKYFKATNYSSSFLNDETAWCSAYVNWVCMTAGYEWTGELTARSWLRVGQKTSKPKIGDIVVFWRESRYSWKGHVGFYINEYKNDIYCLGGNQNNEVNIAKYPNEKLLEFRNINKVL